MALESCVKRINYLWRCFATGLCFATFSGGGLVLTFLVIPVLRRRSENEREQCRKTRQLIGKCFRLFTRMMSLLGVIEFDTRNAGQILARHRGKIVIANHPSLIDVVVLMSIMPHADCIVKKELWNNVFITGVLKAAGYIQNSGDMDNLIGACQKSLNEGNSLIIFPEGTRTSPSAGMVLQRGASNIALRCKVDLVPVLIRCVPSTLTKNEKWYNIPPEKVHFSLEVHEPLDISRFDTENQTANQSLAIKARLLTALIQNHYDKSLQCYG